MILFLGRSHVGILFGASQSTVILVSEVLPVFLIGLVFYAFSRITTSGFYATKRNFYSYYCVYAEPLLLVILLFILSKFWGQAGIWWSVVLAQILTALIALILKRSIKKRIQ